MNMIAVSCRHNSNAQVAFDEAVEGLRRSANRFETAAGHLLDEKKHDAETHKVLREFVDICKTMSTGNVDWRFAVIPLYPHNLLRNILVCARADMGSLIA